MKIEVKHAARTFAVEVEDTATLADLKAAIAKESKVPPTMQKLMGAKLQLKDDTAALTTCGFKEGTKMMLIGNPVEDVVSTHGDSKAKEEKRARDVRNLPGNFWSLPPFAGMLADPFVEGRGRPVEHGNAALALLLMDVAMCRINTLGTNLATLALNDDAANSLDHELLTLTAKERAILARVHNVLRKSLEFTATASNAKEPEEVMILVQSVINNIRSLPDNEWLLIPSGWVNLTYQNVMYILIKKNVAKPSAIWTADGSGDSYDFVVVNTDPTELGCLDFHPQLPTTEKLKGKACLVLPNIAKDKLLDEAFWLLSLSLWIRGNDPETVSEFARGEVIYDVLLPWLYEQDPRKQQGEGGNSGSPTSQQQNGRNPLPRDLSVLFSDPTQFRISPMFDANGVNVNTAASPADFSTPQRSGSGATKALMAAFSFLLRQYGMGEGQIKQLKFVLKYEFFMKAGEDLHVAAKRHLSATGVPSAADAAIASPTGAGGTPTVASSSSPTAPGTASASSAAVPSAFAAVAKRAAAAGKSPAGSPDGRAVATLPPKVVRLAKALEGLTRVGIEANTTTASLSTLFDNMTSKDYFKTANNVLLKNSHFEGKVVAVYFSASWCAPCRKFSPLVVEVYKQLCQRIPNAQDKIEFLVVSADRTKEEYDEYMTKFPFPRMSWPPEEKVLKALDVNGIPTLLIFAPDGTLMTRDGVAAVRQDPEAVKFPSSPWNGASALTSTDLRMLEYAASTLAYRTLKRYGGGKEEDANSNGGNKGHSAVVSTAHASGNGVADRLSDTQVQKIRDVIAAVKAVVNAMPHRADDGKEGSLFDDDADTATSKDTNALAITASGSPSDTSLLPLTIPSEDDFGIVLVPDSAANGRNSGLLNRVSTVRYAGTPFSSTVPNLGDLSNFRVPSNYTELKDVLSQARRHTEALWERAKHSGTSSRVAVQMQIIEFISWIFTFIVPIPRPTVAAAVAIDLNTIPPLERAQLQQFLRHEYHPIRESVTSDLYEGPLPPADPSSASAPNEDAQIAMCQSIYALMLSYATAWQAVETPSRSFDSERALVSVAMLCVYDAIARNTNGSAKGLVLSILLTTDAGGYHVSTSLCKHTRSFKDASSTFELARPQHLAVRDALVTWITFTQLKYPNELFDLRVPHHIELRKHSHTCNFLRRFLENCGYRLGGGDDEEEAGAANGAGGAGGRGRGGMGRTQAQQLGGSEMEKMMYWFCDQRSPLASEHPEFGMLRDMALLTKFMATMEMRDAQLLHKRKEFDEFASWRLSFEEDAPGRQMSAGWRTRPRPPFWDCLLVRGRDMDIADISVKGFGDRSVSTYGEGLCVVSPIDAAAQLGIDYPLEEDVLHAKSLPTFSGVLSQEEAESLWSVLTVPYMRIPLVLDFFSTQDRHTYLFAAPMQSLLRAALFEPGAHIPLSAEEYSKKFGVPMRLNGQQRQEAQIALTMSATAEGDTTRFLGSTFGLLINELQHSPQPVLGPWIRILATTRDLGPSSAYSVNATYVLFLCNTSCDVLSFIHYVLTMSSDEFSCRHVGYLEEAKATIEGLLTELVTPLLSQWLAEAEENDDIPTQCVVHSHMAMVQRALSLGLPAGSPKRMATLVKLLQSCAFVRARHGFGMGFQRTQLASQDGDNTLDPTEKLLRFLQAQGLDTRNTNKEMLEQGRRLMMSGGRRRAVFVQIRGRNHNDTVRVPNLFRSDPTSTAESKALKLPPVDVPENLLFAILQEHFFELSSFINSLPLDRKAALESASAASATGDNDNAALVVAGSDSSLSTFTRSGEPLSLDVVANAIVKTVLKDKAFLSAAQQGSASSFSASPTTATRAAPNTTAWVKGKGSVLIAPTAFLVFHLQTCELFWKDEELKPVPDSMSHYDDYETILGKDIVQCGLVSRSENRHWVHIVGTSYDLIEWTEHDPDDQGVHCPSVAIGPPDVEKIEHVVYLGKSYTRPIDIYSEDPWAEKEERWAVGLVQNVFAAAFPMAGSMKHSPIMTDTVFAPHLPTALNGAGRQVLQDEIRMIMFDKAQYDNEGDEAKATWKELVLTRQTVVRPTPKGKVVVIPSMYGAEWEIADVDIRLDIFTLVPHARRMYRVLHYSTNQRQCLAALELLRAKRAHNEFFKTLRFQVGRLKNRIKNEGTLEIHRYNSELGGREVYVPPRLLQGVVPSCLLENLLFWHGEDDIIRGYPGNSGAAAAAISAANSDGGEKPAAASPTPSPTTDVASPADAKKAATAADVAKAAGEAFANHWFNYSVEIELGPGHSSSLAAKKNNNNNSVIHKNANNLPLGSYRLIRRADKKHRKIREVGAAVPQQLAIGGLGPRSDSSDLTAAAGGNAVDAKSLSTLRSIFGEYPDSVLAHAFKQGKMNIGKAVDWIADPENMATIQAMLVNDAATADDCAADGSSAAVSPTRGGGANTNGGATKRSLGGMPRTNSMTGSSGDLAARGAVGAYGGEGDEVEQTTEDNLELLRLTDCPELAQLAELLTRVEDASHILVWGRRAAPLAADDDNDDNTTAGTNSPSFVIQIIEFPRLRAKFQPKAEEDGRTIHLWLVDSPGWRVAMPSEAFSDKRIVQLMEPWEQCIAMLNVTTRELAFFIPNHDFARMDVMGDPFNRMLLFDRGSVQWMESVPSPFYMLLVHTSREFLVSPSLAASLYAAVVLTARQRYAEAFRYTEACYVDTPFTVEEQFMFSLMARTLTSASGSGKDNHPDAHAARLKFAHAALYSPNELSWALETEVSRYLLKHQHVSRCCRLTREELTDLLKRCRRATPIIKCQLEYWVQQRRAALLASEADGSSSENTVTSAKIVPPPIEKAGRPWAKLKAMPTGAITSTCSKITRLQYKDPQQLLHDTALVKWLYEDLLLQDEESGSNTNCGFFFLYSLLRKRPQLNMRFLGKDVSATMGSLLSRWFQLRHARWGKEFSGTGEAEFIPSYMMVALADCESFPNATWPQLSDPVTLGFMSRGGVSVNQQINNNNNRMWGRDGGGAAMMMGGMMGGGGDNNGPTPLGRFVRDLERCVQDCHRSSTNALPTHKAPDRVVVQAYDYVIPRIMPSDTAQDCVVITGGSPKAANSSPAGSSVAVGFSDRTAASMATFLFEEIGIFERFVTVKEPPPLGAAGSAACDTAALPFDVSQHPLAQSHVARDMLSRLEGDVRTFEQMRATTTQYLLRMLDDVSRDKLLEPLWRCDAAFSCAASSATHSQSTIAIAIQNIMASLSELVDALTTLHTADNTAVGVLAETLMALANGVHYGTTRNSSDNDDNADNADNATARVARTPMQGVLHDLHRSAGSRTAITVEWLCGALLSTQFAKDVAAMNPMHGDLDTIRSLTIQFMMLSNRSYFGAQTIGAAHQLLRFMEMVQSMGRFVFAMNDDGSTEEERRARVLHYAALLSVDHDTNLSGHASMVGIGASMRGRFTQLVGALSEQVSVCRHYVVEKKAAVEEGGSPSYTLDPRFLAFEFIFSIILRKRQVEMIRWFKNNIDNGSSRVQQMIMGQGKTTVVGPLLALMLGDGETLVTQVMPTALLEQSRNVLRRCFSVIIPKRIFTLQFDRGVDDSDGVIEILFQKLQSAQQNRSIVVSAPESIKALFLKYIEQLHALEATPEGDLVGGDSAPTATAMTTRKQREARLIKNKAIARSKMADAIVPILHMWRDGVLIMDEVDVLLHPLRSELNFPIGLKHPIELSGARWLLPIHILDGIFYTSRGRASGTLAAASSAVKGVDNHPHIGAANNDDDDTPNTNQQPPAPFTPNTDDVEEVGCLEALSAVLHKGIEVHTVQREPHIVLLDNHFYHNSMKSVVADWTLLWLWRTISKEQAKARRQAQRQQQLAALARLGQDDADEEGGEAVKKGSPSLADAPFLNITKERFYAIAKSFLLESRAISNGPANAANGYAALLQLGAEMSTNLLPHAVQLLFLARDWLDTLLPHVLAKINRVGYGILQPNDYASLSNTSSSSSGASGSPPAGMPLSRRLMAIPFVAKDVPSRSSEFAHPDVVIGLTILAYRYEGLRRSDVKELLLQLKHDYSRQTGPRERRPAAILYNSWLTKARADRDGTASSKKRITIVPSSESPTTDSHLISVESSASRTQQPKGANVAAPFTKDDDEYASVPLSQLQVLDPTQLTAVYNTLRTLPEAAHYYLCQHTFPRTMNFQKLKLSACGHELASSILFGKRIGFSGTPSNLLPLDMGACEYEPGSDGKILNVLTDPTITSCDELEEGWTPLKVLRRIATANPPFHALIDTGALITNMDNEQVARYLIEHLPESFEGVVFLDSSDKQVVLQRNNMQIVPLSQCGVALSRRFTFFDQVHTTGMDIKQSPTATAVVTIGKDMVFRDYAQGAFRMRGIGKGQRIKLYLIPEVVARVREALSASDPLFNNSTLPRSNAINIPAWLLLNAMRIEGLQFVKLSQQELENIWRKLALRYLVQDSSYAVAHPTAFTDYERVRRFALAATKKGNNTSNTSGSSPATSDPAFLAKCIASFREIIGFPVPDHVTPPVGYAEKVKAHFEDKPRCLLTGPASTCCSHADPMSDNLLDAASSAQEEDAESVKRIDFVMHRMMAALDVHGKDSDEMNLNAEVVHEQEAEEEQEQEAEQEEQRISAFTRDDEQQIGWDIRVIDPTNQYFASGEAATASTTKTLEDKTVIELDSPFYPCSHFQVRAEQPRISVPPYLTLSDNFYRKRWAGLGERRLRNCVVFAQWIVYASSDEAANTNKEHTTQGAVITLAEAETLRWLLHHNNAVQTTVPVAIRIVGSGRYVEASRCFREAMREARLPAATVELLAATAPNAAAMVGASGGSSKTTAAGVTNRVLYAAECRGDFMAINNSGSGNNPTTALTGAAAMGVATREQQHTLTDPLALWFRFFNNDMFYTAGELHTLAHRVLSTVSLPDRVSFFMECLRLRRRHRNDFEDAPIADLFTADEDRDELKDIAELKKLEVALLRFAKNAPSGGGSASAAAAAKANPNFDFMTEEEQLQHLLLKSHEEAARAENGGLANDDLHHNPNVNPFMAVLRVHLRRIMQNTISEKEQTNSTSGTFLTAKEAAAAFRDALLASVKESISGATTKNEEEPSASASAAPTATTNVRLPSSLANIDLEGAMARVESVLLERALHEAAARARGGGNMNSNSSSSTATDHKITYESLVAILPVLHVEYEAIEEARLASAKSSKKEAKRAARRAAAAAAGPIENWNCPCCTFSNNGVLTACGICYSPRPAGMGADAAGAGSAASPTIGNDDSDDESADEGGSMPVDWNCPACTFLNEGAAPECGICNTPNPTPPPKKKGGADKAGGAASSALAGGGGWEREVPEGHWVCSVEHGGCSMYNPDNWYYCRACDKARPNLASLRF